MQNSNLPPSLSFLPNLHFLQSIYGMAAAAAAKSRTSFAAIWQTAPSRAAEGKCSRQIVVHRAVENVIEVA